MGIYIAAAITTVTCALFYGWLIWRMAAPSDRSTLLIAFLIALPLQPLAFYLVRMPLHGALSAALGPGLALTMISLWYASLTEEPAKWLPLLVPAIRRSLTPLNAVVIALTVGLGFGIGEIWFLAEQLARIPAVTAQPFYAFGGFFIERSIVCFLHGAFIVFAYRNLATGRSFWLGGLIGMVLHFALNFPIFLGGIIPLGPAAWSAILMGWIVLVAVALGAVVSRMTGGRFRLAMLGTSTCPECRAAYPRPLLALNFGPVRYERCPHCRRFHWVRLGRSTT